MIERNVTIDEETGIRQAGHSRLWRGRRCDRPAYRQGYADTPPITLLLLEAAQSVPIRLLD
jgi:hypothetical protein